MKFLLTSAGIKNTSIHDALVDLLGKPIAESNALCIPTGGYGTSMAVLRDLAFHQRTSAQPMCGLGWKSLGVLELTALPSIGDERWVPWVRDADVLLVNGGDALYLCHWMRQSGLADLLPSLRETVYVGFSAGSMVMTPRIGEDFVGWKPPTGGDSTLGIVDFSIFPHVDHPDLPENTMADAEKWAAGLRASGVCNRRRDRHQSDRRRRRGRLRGALEAVHPSRYLRLRAALSRSCSTRLNRPCRRLHASRAVPTTHRNWAREGSRPAHTHQLTQPCSCLQASSLGCVFGTASKCVVPQVGHSSCGPFGY